MSWIGDAWNWLNSPTGSFTPNPEDAKLQGGDEMRGVIRQGLAGAQGRTAPQVGYLDATQSNEWRDRMTNLADQYGAVASGEQAGAGELAAQRQAARALQSQKALASMSRGGGGALAARAAASNATDIAGQAAGQAQQAALQDQAAARQGLGQLAGMARGQDISMAQANAQMDLANQAATLQQRGMNDQQIIALLAQQYGIDAAEMQARLQQANQRIAQLGQSPLGTIGGMVGAIGQGMTGAAGVGGGGGGN